MKEHLLTLFLTVTTALTLTIFSMISTHGSIPVFDANEILFKHQTIHGNFVITADAYDNYTLSFINRGIINSNKMGNFYGVATAVDDIYFLSLTSSNITPFMTYALVSQNSDLYEVVVFAKASQIAHATHAKKTTCDQTAVFMVSSVDLVGKNVLILGLDQAGTIVLEIEIPGQSYGLLHQ